MRREGGGKGHASAALPPGKKPGARFKRRLGGPSGSSGRVRKISFPTEIFFVFFCTQ